MNVLIVYAHPEPSSFTAALKDRAVAVLQAEGHAVAVSDLYAERFNPVAGRHDFTTVCDAARFHYQSEQDYAAKQGGFAPDLVREQRRMAAAHLLVFVFPLWWGGLPAILKGWFDRVLAYGFAYAEGKRYEHGYFVGRRAVMALTTGGTAERFSSAGCYGPMRDVLHAERRCMLEYLGLEVAEPFVAYAAPRVDAATREAYLQAWQARLRQIVSDPDWLARLGDALRETELRRTAESGERGWTRAG